jgi:hypothetical protein
MKKLNLLWVSSSSFSFISAEIAVFLKEVLKHSNNNKSDQ